MHPVMPEGKFLKQITGQLEELKDLVPGDLSGQLEQLISLMQTSNTLAVTQIEKLDELIGLMGNGGGEVFMTTGTGGRVVATEPAQPAEPVEPAGGVTQVAEPGDMCQAVTKAGKVCGRARPCRHHDK